MNKESSSVRQLAEHGMRMIQGQFPQTYEKFQLEEFGERKVVTHLLILLCDCQTSKVEINQIMNTFMSERDGFCSHTSSEERVSIPEDVSNVFNVWAASTKGHMLSLALCV